MFHHAKPFASTVASLLLSFCLVACGKQPSSADLLAQATQSLRHGQDRAALIQLKNAAIASPEDVEVRFSLASVYLRIGDGASAEKELKKAVEHGGSGMRAAPSLIGALLVQGRAKQAIDETEKYSKNASPILLVKRGDAFLILGDSQRAEDSYQKALSDRSSAAGALVGLAKVASKKKDHPAALRFAARAIAENPADPEPWIYNGQLLRQHGRRSEAIASFSKAIALSPATPGAYIERASDQIATRNFLAAKEDIAKAHALAPGTLPVVYLQAHLDWATEKYSNARKSIQMVLADAPDHMPSLLLAGMVESKLGNINSAEQHLRKYIEALPDNTDARLLLARVLLKGSRPAEATAVLDPILRVGTEDPQLYALAGESSMLAGDFRNSMAYFQRATLLAPDNAALHASLAMSQVRSGDNIKAAAELETATALDPGSLAAGIASVQVQLNLKHYDNALSIVKNLERDHPGDSDVSNFKGGIYLAQGKLAAARLSFENAASLKPDNFDPVKNLADLNVRSGRLEDATKTYLRFLDANKGHIGAMLGLAEVATVKKDQAQAAEWLVRATTENPKALLPSLKLAEHYLRTEDQQKALVLLQTTRIDHPSHPILLGLLGQAQLATNDPSAALDSFNRLVSVSPKPAAALVRIAAVHIAMKNFSSALQDFERAVTAEPDYLPARVGQIFLLMDLGKKAEATGLIQVIQKRAPKSPLGYILEGDMSVVGSRFAQAVPAYQKAFSLSPTSEIVIKLADATSRSGQQRDAENILVQWLRGYPTDILIARHLSQHYLDSKQYDLAAEELRALLKRSPDDSIALNNLAWVYQQQKDPRALKTAERAIALTPDSPASQDTLGWMLVEKNDLVRGLALLHKSADAAPNSKEIRYHLAVALYRSGDLPKARRELEDLLRDGKPFSGSDNAVALLKSM